MNAPYDRNGAYVSNDVDHKGSPRALPVHLTYTSLAAADTDGIHTAVTDTGVEQTITTGITNPDYPRVITATAGGTAADIKAIQVVVTGTNYAGETITETLPAFTANTAGTVTGSKAFKTVTSITIPAHDGTGATTAIGWGKAVGLPYMLPYSTLLMAKLGGTADTGTITADTDELEKNLFTLNGAPDGSKDVDIYLLV
jgi:hypothetical protein